MAFRFFRKPEKTDSALNLTRKSWGSNIFSFLTHAGSVSEEYWEQLEDALISADIGVPTSVKLVERVRQRAKKENLREIQSFVDAFKEELASLLMPEMREDLIIQYDDTSSKPFVILIVGVNGVGKTTSIAKIATHYIDHGKKVIIGAGDTYRAAAIEQIQIWGKRLGVDVVAHQAGSDPGAVAYDAYAAARSRKADVLIFDTAGRLHNKDNLMQELQKISRIFNRNDELAPHQTLLVIDATTGQNGLQQARIFKESVGINGVFLTKLDGTAKGGIVVAIAQELEIPVMFVRTGESMEDFSLFETEDFVNALFKGQIDN